MMKGFVIARVQSRTNPTTVYELIKDFNGFIHCPCPIFKNTHNAPVYGCYHTRQYKDFMKTQKSIGFTTEAVPYIANGEDGEPGSENGGITMASVVSEPVVRIPTNLEAIDRFFGGGIAKGFSYLMWGEPGSNKSTLLGYMLSELSKSTKSVAHLLLEESLSIYKNRLDNFKIRTDLTNWHLYFNNDIYNILRWLGKLRPEVVVIDSLQMLVAQKSMNHSALKDNFMVDIIRKVITREFGISAFVISHANKDGDASGSNTIQHMLDATMVMQIDENLPNERILTMRKNRTGPSRTQLRVTLDEGKELTISEEVPLQCVPKSVPTNATKDTGTEKKKKTVKLGKLEV